MTRLMIDFDWDFVGPVDTDSGGGLLFPRVSTDPGLYRFWIECAGDRPAVYIGEASNLRRRLQQYRTPGADQRTNRRLNRLLRKVITRGGMVTVWCVSAASIAFDARMPDEFDLSRKNQRLVAEQAAIAEALVVEDLADTDGGPRLAPRLLNKPGVGESRYK